LRAQPAPFAEELIGAAAERVVRHVLDAWAANHGPIDADHYVRAFTPATIAAWCAEYRAAFHLDRAIDAADRAAGRTIGCPVLVHWAASEDPMLPTWRRWATDVRGGPLPGGHFLPEEAGAGLAASLREFLVE
jgi:haloacetate dehalogenase